MACLVHEMRAIPAPREVDLQPFRHFYRTQRPVVLEDEPLFDEEDLLKLGHFAEKALLDEWVHKGLHAMNCRLVRVSLRLCASFLRSLSVWREYEPC